jgi:hypothetical protein
MVGFIQERKRRENGVKEKGPKLRKETPNSTTHAQTSSKLPQEGKSERYILLNPTSLDVITKAYGYSEAHITSLKGIRSLTSSRNKVISN